MNKVAYSPSEEKLLDILKKHKEPVLSSDLCNEFYIGREKPWHAQQQIISTMRSLIKKSKHNKESFIIRKTDRNGPHPISFHFKSKV